MSRKHSTARQGQLGEVSALFLFLVGACFSMARAQDPCEAALQSQAGTLTLSASSPLTATATVPEWESDILKLRITQAGLLTLNVEGMEAEASITTRGSSGLRMVNQEPAGPGVAVHTPVIPSEVYCLRMTPEPGSSGSLTVHLQLTDLCHLGPHVDDHGDSFDCATELVPGVDTAGALNPGDRDAFAFSLVSGATVDIQASGAVALSGKLFDATGALLATGDGTNLLISESLSAGRYFLRIGSGNPGGDYTVSVALLP